MESDGAEAAGPLRLGEQKVFCRKLDIPSAEWLSKLKPQVAAKCRFTDFQVSLLCKNIINYLFCFVIHDE